MTIAQENESNTGSANGADIELLAEEVYRLLLQEMRIEQERIQRTAGQTNRNRRIR